MCTYMMENISRRPTAGAHRPTVTRESPCAIHRAKIPNLDAWATGVLKVKTREAGETREKKTASPWPRENVDVSLLPLPCARGEAGGTLCSRVCQTGSDGRRVNASFLATDWQPSSVQHSGAVLESWGALGQREAARESGTELGARNTEELVDCFRTN